MNKHILYFTPVIRSESRQRNTNILTLEGKGDRPRINEKICSYQFLLVYPHPTCTKKNGQKREEYH